jgi:peroxiredoxin
MLSVLTLSACTNRQTFTVEGTISGAQDQMLYLYTQSLGGPVAIDSAKLGSSGHFSFEGDAPQCPEFYILRIDNQIINISIDSTETVTITAQWPGMAANYEVKGSDNSEKIRQLALKQQTLQKQVYALERDGSLTDEVRRDSLRVIVNAYKDDVMANYIYKEPQQSYAYFALFQTIGPWNIFERNNPQDIKAFGAVATCWETYYPHALRTEHLRNTTLKGMNEHRAVTARQQQTIDSEKIITAGMIELRLPDATGTIRTLSELNGRVVMLDFHAYSLDDSAQRILMLRELYNKYHDRGLEIYQVSIDSDEHFWKQQTAQLPWVCVYDPDGTSLPSYNVQEVPEFFLIDRDSQLQKRSSQMTDLEAEIRQLL